jgi:hypothetical protein
VATNYPGGLDEFREPSKPGEIPLSQAGEQTGSTLTNPGRNHFQHHRDLGDAVEALERNASQMTHDHSGSGTSTTRGVKLNAANTHEGVDTTSATAIHHTLGSGATNAAAGNHTHDYSSSAGGIINRPHIICTSSTRPTGTALFAGLTIYETNTNRFWVYNNSRWNIVVGGSIPVVRLAQSQAQSISPGGTFLQWKKDPADLDTEDPFLYFVPPSGQTTSSTITVTEPGLYQLDVALQWGVNFIPEIVTVVACIGGQEQSLRNSSFQARSGFLSLFGLFVTPDFSQTINLSGKLRVTAGQQLSIKCRYGGITPLGAVINTYFDLDSKVRSRLELQYIGP